jgi:hypothetical protein
MFNQNMYLPPSFFTVRADMTILDITKTLSALLNINAIFLFLFLDFRMLHSRRRLDETPTITHGATLVLKRWKVDQAIHWSSCYGRLSTEEIKTMFGTSIPLVSKPHALRRRAASGSRSHLRPPPFLIWR